MKFPLGTIAFLYQSGIDRIERAFETSIAQIAIDQAAARKEYEDYLASGKDDSEYEYDDEGYSHLIHSTAFDLDYATMEVDLSAQAICEAFIITTYHYWEKCAKSWTGKDGIESLTESSPYRTDSKLPALNKLNNHLKHSSKLGRMVALHGEWANLFQVEPHRVPETNKAHWILTVQTDHVREAFRIVRASGPVYTT